ncbi:MAG: L,D-transpeptidase [Caldisericota bacterium]|jgi:lipoprotein-anchoring transpeptidase ErfK/SrfK|nr:L,D-transpeptidase [Caldisericota bacterium]
MEKIIFLVFLLILVTIIAPLGGSVGVYSWESPNKPSGDFILSMIKNFDLIIETGKNIQEKIYSQFENFQSRTSPAQKKIVVSLTKQSLALIEGGKVLAIFPTLTGAKGMGTPPGNYKVLSKYRSVTMEGQIGTPLEYRVENVPWVLFFIDRAYAIHGNYWKPLNYFGKDPSFTGSHGCVGLTPEDAKKVFDWAEVGTEIEIQE